MKLNKLFILSVMLITLVSVNIYALNPERVTSLNKNFGSNIVASLNSENKGVVEASILILMSAKKYYPELNLTKAVNKISELSQESKNLTIRYKAQLALMYVNFPELFSDLDFRDNENPDKYYLLINERLVKNSLASY
ncbi:MAG: hypothetical protein KF816_00430 [Melioribacteraceae bacterium]|nr:hypothetical protein [Melioribacteraceae bacterium]